MKTRTILVAIAVALVPMVAMAAEFRAGEDRVHVSDEVIADNLYVGGGDVVVDSDVQGDLFVGGGNVEVTGSVADDLFVGGGNVRITGSVNGDVRIGGGNVRVDGDINGELMVGGGGVDIGEDAAIAGATYIGAGQLTVAGTTGPLMVGAERIRLASTSHVNGDLNYTSVNGADIAEGAVITGETTHTTPPHPRADKATSFAGGGILWLITGLIMVLLYVYMFPNKAQAVSMDWKNRFWFNLLVGFVFLVVVPATGVVLMISIIGIPLGLGVFLLYPIALYVGKLAATVAAGAWLRSLMDKDAGIKVDWISAAVGFVVLALIALVPALGAIVVFTVFLAGLGALIRYDWGLIQGLREQKKF